MRNFHRTHGLQGDEFHFGASHAGHDGRLYFGGSNGFNAFDPDALKPVDAAPPVVLSRVSKMNVPIDAGAPLTSLRELQVGYQENAVTFEFAALDFTDPDNNRYRYRLDGFDEDWVDAGSRRSATYTNLDSGNYTFEVRAVSSEGAWNNDGLAVSVQVAPPPWQTTGAYGLYGLLLCGVMAMLIRAQTQKRRREAAYRLKLENEVNDRTRELEASNQELQHLTRAKGEFLARMSHEIRSPINGVLGMSELLALGELNDRQRSSVATIHQSADSLLRIVNDLLDFSKLESGKMSIEPIEADLEALIDDTIATFAVEAHKKGLELVSVLPSTGLPRLRLDPVRLRQVFLNLLHNAIKFTERGNVVLEALLLTETANDARLSFRIQDTGIGIAPENQSRIFDSFSQEDGSTTRRFGGTGLGLSISKELVEVMGGQLNLTSIPGQGSTFHFQVTFDKADEEPARRESPFELDVSCVVLCQDKALGEQLSRYLSSWGATCRQVGSGPALVEAASRSTGDSFDLAVVDTRLQTSTQLHEYLKAQGHGDSIQVLSLAPADADGSESTENPEAGLLHLPLKRR